MESASSSRYMTCVLKLDARKPGWQKSMNKVLETIKGVTFTIDEERRLACVSGKTHPEIIIQKITEAGKNAELIWVDYAPINEKRCVVNTHPCYNYCSGYPNAHGPPNFYPWLEPWGRQPYWHPRLAPPPPPPPFIRPGHQLPPAVSYEPPARIFPQPPLPPKDYIMGEPQCMIM